MADDLVQRLRVSAGTAPHWLRNVYREAADEIERLRAEVAEAKRRASNAEFELAGLEQMRLRDNQYLIERAEAARMLDAALREMVRED